jgi:hypothetical protein
MAAPEWTLEEIEYVKTHYRTDDVKNIAKTIGRTVNAVRLRAKMLGISAKCIWTPVEDRYIKRYYPTGDIKKMALRLNRSVESVKKRASVLKVYKEKAWTDEDNEYLAETYPNLDISSDDIAKRFGVTKKQLCRHCFEICVQRREPHRDWTTREIKFVKDNYLKMSTFRLAAEIERTPETIYRLVSLNGWFDKPKNLKRRKRKPPKKKMDEILWSSYEVAFLMDFYKTMHYTQISRKLGRSKKAIMCKMRKLGIYQDRLKIFFEGSISFYYNTEEEKTQKLEYMEFWRDSIYAEFKRKVA